MPNGREKATASQQCHLERCLCNCVPHGRHKVEVLRKGTLCQQLVYGPRSEPALSGISRFLGVQLRATTLKTMQVSTPEQIPLPGSQRRWKMKLVHSRDFKAYHRQLQIALCIFFLPPLADNSHFMYFTMCCIRQNRSPK